MLEGLYHSAILLILAHCAWTDITSLKIRNNDVLALMATIAMFWLAGARAISPADGLLAASIFVVAFGFWMLGAIGGGDVKLLGAVTLALGSPIAVNFAIALLICALLWLFMLRHRWTIEYFVPLPATLRAAISERRVPYGVCIALAAAAAIFRVYAL